METREVVHPRSDVPKEGMTGFIYSMNSIVPTPIIGSYDESKTIVVHGYEIRRGLVGEKSQTVSLVELIENEGERKTITEMLRVKGFKQPIEFW